MQGKISDRGQFMTSKASQYLQQLCKHFADKIDVEFDETSGKAAFPFGTADMRATQNALEIDLNADSEEDLQRARFAIDKHLERFAFREDFTTMDWRRG